MTIILFNNVRTLLSLYKGGWTADGRELGTPRNLNFYSCMVAQPVDWMLPAAPDRGMPNYTGK